MGSIRNIVNNVIITLYGNGLLPHLPMKSHHNICAKLLHCIPKTNIMYADYNFTKLK